MSTNRLRASLVDLTFAIWVIALPTALSFRVLNTDGDLARHIVMGRHILSDGPRLTDVFSHTRAGADYLAYEWLSQITFALLHDVAGLAGVLVFTALLLAAAYALIVRFMLRRGVDPLLAYLVGVAAALLGSAHWSARPHLFSVLGVVALLGTTARAGASAGGTDMDAGASATEASAGSVVGWRAVLPVAALFLVWANFHPGFVLGLAILGTLALGSLAESLVASGAEERARWRARAVRLGVFFGAGAMATVVNPRGVGLHLHILEHLGNPFMMRVTDEFRPLDFHSVYGAVFAVVLVLVAAGLAARRERPSLDRLFVIALLLAGALSARRNVPLFGLYALPLLALELNGVWSRLGGRFLNHVRAVFRAGESDARPGRYVPWLASAFILLALLDGRVAGVRVLRDTFDARTFPVEAVAHARSAGLEGRVFNEFTWGGYLLYAWPEQRIFIDGMTDFFGEEVTRGYLRIVELAPGWDEELERAGVTIVVLPTVSALAHELALGGWDQFHVDDTAVVLLRPDRQQNPHTLPVPRYQP